MKTILKFVKKTRCNYLMFFIVYINKDHRKNINTTSGSGYCFLKKNITLLNDYKVRKGFYYEISINKDNKIQLFKQNDFKQQIETKSKSKSKFLFI